MAEPDRTEPDRIAPDHTAPDHTAELAASFDRAADVYERSRPEYPLDAVRWLVPQGATDVLDLGAGTGKLTRVVAGLVPHVFAVDPSPKMLDQLRTAVPGVTALEGTAESIPLDDATVDGVVVGQAWHWVDQERALPEVARVLRPGGTLGLVWNQRDESVPWVARLTEIMHPANGEIFLKEGTIQAGPFEPLEREQFTWTMEFTRPQLLDLANSRSYVITATDDERAEIAEGINRLLDEDPALAGRQSWTMPYRTHCFRMRLPT